MTFLRNSPPDLSISERFDLPCPEDEEAPPTTPSMSAPMSPRRRAPTPEEADIIARILARPRTMSMPDACQWAQLRTVLRDLIGCFCGVHKSAYHGRGCPLWSYTDEGDR